MLCPIYFIIVRKYHIFLQPCFYWSQLRMKITCIVFFEQCDFLLIYEIIQTFHLALFTVVYPNHFKEADFRQASYSGINWMIPICGKQFMAWYQYIDN